MELPMDGSMSSSVSLEQLKRRARISSGIKGQQLMAQHPLRVQGHVDNVELDRLAGADSDLSGTVDARLLLRVVGTCDDAILSSERSIAHWLSRNTNYDRTE